MNEIIAQLFAARNIAHSLHLSTRSFAQHVALGDFYTGIIPLADALAEAHAGRYGVVNVDTNSAHPQFQTTDAVQFIYSVAAWAESVRSQFSPDDTFILNQWDEILSLVNSTKYKLEYLA